MVVVIFWLNKYFRFMKKSFVWIYIYIGKYLKFDWLRVFYYDRKIELDIINYIIIGWEFLIIKEIKLDIINLLLYFYYNYFIFVYSYN